MIIFCSPKECQAKSKPSTPACSDGLSNAPSFACDLSTKSTRPRCGQLSTSMQHTSIGFGSAKTCFGRCATWKLNSLMTPTTSSKLLLKRQSICTGKSVSLSKTALPSAWSVQTKGIRTWFARLLRLARCTRSLELHSHVLR